MSRIQLAGLAALVVGGTWIAVDRREVSPRTEAAQSSTQGAGIDEATRSALGAERSSEADSTALLAAPASRARRVSSGAIRGVVTLADEPVFRAELVVKRWSSGESARLLGQTRLVTDESGEFLLPLVDAQEATNACELEVTLVHPPHGLDQASSGRIDCGPVSSGATFDLGRISIQSGPLAVSGVAVGPGGLPLRGASLRIRTSSRAALTTGSLRDPLTSSVDGHFTSYAALPETGQYFLEASHPDFPGETFTQFEQGERHVVVELGTTLSVRGRVLSDVPISDAELRVQLEDRAHAGFVRKWMTAVSAEGEFELDGIAPGTYALSIAIASDLDESVRRRRPLENTLWTRESIAIADPSRDGFRELDPIDLRGAVDRVGVRCVDREGEPLANVRVTLSASARTSVRAGSSEAWTTDSEGLFQKLVATDDREPWLCSIEGFSDAEARPLPGIALVTMSRRIPVHLHVPSVSDVAGPYSLYVSMTPASLANAGEGRGSSDVVRVDEYGNADVELDEPGPYTIDVWLVLEDEGHTVRSSVRGPSGNPGQYETVQVERSMAGDVATFVARTSPDGIEHALVAIDRVLSQ